MSPKWIMTYGSTIPIGGQSSIVQRLAFTRVDESFLIRLGFNYNESKDTVGATVLAFWALGALANGLVGWVGGLVGYPDLTFQGLLGHLLAPVMLLLGIPWQEAQTAGGLFGTKMVLNEFVAFIDLQGLPAEALSERSRSIVIFALCGFANLSSMPIQVAVTGGLAPNPRPVNAGLGGGVVSTPPTPPGSASRPVRRPRVAAGRAGSRARPPGPRGHRRPPPG